jgi:hypothetical protein
MSTENAVTQISGCFGIRARDFFWWWTEQATLKLFHGKNPADHQAELYIGRRANKVMGSSPLSPPAESNLTNRNRRTKMKRELRLL